MTKEKCTDKKCPKHHGLSTRGFKLKGTVVSDKMNQSVIVERIFNKYVPKYQSYEKCKTRIAAHNPGCINAKLGDRVLIQQCMPLSKTKHFTIVEKLEHESRVDENNQNRTRVVELEKKVKK